MRLRHKFNAKRTAVGGRTYASKLEAKYASFLAASKASGSLIDWLEQVPMRLPGGIVYRLDFLEFWESGIVIFTEVKGMETPAWKMKKALLEETYPWLDLNIVRKM